MSQSTQQQSTQQVQPSTTFPRLGHGSRMLGFHDPFEDFFSDPLFQKADETMQALWSDVGALTPHPHHRHLKGTNNNNNNNEARGNTNEQKTLTSRTGEKSLSGSSDSGQDLVPFKNSDWLQSYVRAPAVEIVPKENEFLVQVQVPGVRKEDVKINVTQDEQGRKMLNISGERKEERSQQDSQQGTAAASVSYGKFSRSLLLPLGAQVEGINAKQDKQGQLSIHVPRVPVKGKIQAMDIDIQ